MAREETDRVDPGHRRLLAVAAAATFILVTLGGTVCVTGATLGCPDWPACYGRLVPPARADSVIEYTHRLFALLASVLVLAAAVNGWRKARHAPWVARPPLLAVALFGAVAVFGAFAVLTGLPPWLAAVDLGSALAALALMVTAATISRARRGVRTGQLTLQGSFQRLVAASWGTTFLVLVLGVLVAQPGSVARCLGWPLYGGREVAAVLPGLLPDLRVALSGAAMAGILTSWLYARRHLQGDAALVRLAGVAVALLAAELALGAWLVVRGPSAVTLVLYVALAAGLWTALTALTTAAALGPTRRPARDRPARSSPIGG